MITRRCHSYTVQLPEARAALRAASRIPPCGPVLNPTAARRKKEGSQASGALLCGPTPPPCCLPGLLPPRPATPPLAPTQCFRGEACSRPRVPGPAARDGSPDFRGVPALLPLQVLGKSLASCLWQTGTRTISVCLGNSRKGSSVQANPSGLSTAPPAAPASRRVPTPSGPVQQGRGSSFIMAEPAGKGQRAPQSRQQVHPPTPG